MWLVVYPATDFLCGKARLLVEVAVLVNNVVATVWTMIYEATLVPLTWDSQKRMWLSLEVGVGALLRADVVYN